MRRPLTLFAATALGVAGIAVASHHEMPKGFREWTQVKSMVITDAAHGLYGFHNVYANAKALPALKAGKTYASGSAFAVSFYEVKQDGAMITQGKKIQDVLMTKDAGAKETGQWRFAAFDAEGKPKAIEQAKCFDCHVKGAKDSDFVFSKWVE
jgi:hypothetical protein